MNYENTFLPTLERLAQLIHRRYGYECVYQPLDQLSAFAARPEADWAHLELELAKGRSVSAGDWIFLPIFSDQTLAGAVRLSVHKHDENLEPLCRTIRLVVESSLSHINRLDLLKQFETYTEEMKEREQRPNVVVPLQRFQPNPFPLPQKKSNAAFNFPFLIESPEADEAYKMALEIHSRSGRYAILPLCDLSPSVFEDPESIKKLGPITIYIEEISALPFKTQLHLLRYYQTSRDKNCPQFVSCTTKSVSDLKRSQEVAPELLSFLMIGYLCMQQPFATYKRENILEFFYDNLTGRTSV